MSKALVAYFSATGTTERLAEKVAKATGGDLFGIQSIHRFKNLFDSIDVLLHDKVSGPLAGLDHALTVDQHHIDAGDVISYRAVAHPQLFGDRSRIDPFGVLLYACDHFPLPVCQHLSSPISSNY